MDFNHPAGTLVDWSSQSGLAGRWVRSVWYIPGTWVTPECRHMGDRSGRPRRPSADALEGNLRRVGTTSPDEVRVKLVREGIGVSEAARTLGISRKTAYK